MRSAARLLNILFLLGSFNALAQKSTARQIELEVQKERLTIEIKQINKLLFKNTKKKKDVLSEVEDLNLKISVRSQLVNVNNQQANLLTRQISVNERDIGN